MYKYNYYNTKTKQPLFLKHVQLELSNKYKLSKITNSTILNEGYLPVIYNNIDYEEATQKLSIDNGQLINNTFVFTGTITEKTQEEKESYQMWLDSLTEEENNE